MTLYLPDGTSLEGTSGDAPVEAITTGTEAGRAYASFLMDVPASETRKVQLSLRLAPRAPGAYELLVVPSPRIRPTTVLVDIDAGSERVVGEVSLDRTWQLRSGAEPEAVLAPAFRSKRLR